MPERCLLVLSTAGSPKEAEKIARGLLGKKLAACVNILPGARSWYRWQGKIESSQESLLFIKTTSSCLRKLTSALKELHSYDVPEIIALPITAGDHVYLQWLKKNIKSP